MATNITWVVTNLEAKSDIITTAHWRCSGTDGEFSAEVYSSQSLPEPTDTIIKLSKVSEENVLDWIWAHGVDKEATELAVTQKLAELASPVVERIELPWVK